MDGIHFVVDAEGKKTAVIIDLEKHGDLLEDFFDIVISADRLDCETPVPFEDVVAEIEASRSRVEETERVVSNA